MKIQSLWIGDQLTTMELLCVQSFLINGHNFDLYAYDHVEPIPNGARLLDARAIGMRSTSGFGAAIKIKRKPRVTVI